MKKKKVISKESEKQKQENTLRTSFAHAINRAKMAWSFGRIKTLGDVKLALGYDEKELHKQFNNADLSRALTYPEFKECIADAEKYLEEQIHLLYEPAQTAQLFEVGKELDTSFNRDIQDFSLRFKHTLLPEHALSIKQKESKHDKDYGLHPSPKEKAFLFWFQKKACKQLWDALTVKQLRGILLVAATGVGKTFIAGALFRRLLDANFHVGKTLSPWPYIYVTKASIVEQTIRVFEEFFQIDTVNEVLVINIDQLRSKFGKLFVREEVTIVDGEEHIKWNWRKGVYPCFILWDECQVLMNEGSQQSKIAQSYNELDNTYQIFMSASPFMRVAGAKCFVVASRIPFTYGLAKDAPMTNEHWPEFARTISDPADPLEHSPAAIDRLMDYMDKYVVRVKGVKSQFKAVNRVEMIEFETEEDRQFYFKAWERYLTEKAKLETDESMAAGQSKFLILVEMLKFRQAAELCRAKHIAKAMFDSVNYNNQAAVAALNFKATIIKIVQILVNEFKVPRDNISLIWGGGQSALTDKQKKKKKIAENQQLIDMMKEEGISFDDIDLDRVELKIQEELDPSLRLGIQSKEQRQHEIDKFQKGKSLYCLYTFRAGGVGLSLHHTDERTNEWNEKVEGFKEWLEEIKKWNKDIEEWKKQNPGKECQRKVCNPGKVRHKDSGYAFEEDIKYIPTRQRVNFVAPTYSAIELVQGLGRCPRLTSLSDTPQTLVFYRGTIEEKVARIVSMKLRCLTKVVRQHEEWGDVVVGNYSDEEVERRHLGEPTDRMKDKENGNEKTEGVYYEDEDESENEEEEE
jgi:hypothetical protein